jgi:hypothetical protein
MRLRAVNAALPLHHVSRRHVHTALCACLHGAGLCGGGSGGWMGFGGLGLALVQGIQAVSAPQPNRKQNRQQ